MMCRGRKVLCTMGLLTFFDPSMWHGFAAVLVHSSRSWTLAMAELPPMKWLIFGCGGVGGYFGARIAQVKGQRVSYIAACQQLSSLIRTYSLSEW